MLSRVWWAVAALAVVATLASVSSGYAGGLAADATSQTSLVERTLSPHWSPKVQQWATLIIQAAERRHLDPDFLASLIWRESRGNAQAIGPRGSVGLMQVMPKEAGFGWRPTRAELLDPFTNLFWGSRTLATVIMQGKGDVFHALAAYNGGWEQIGYAVPRQFATTILRDYAQAIAVRSGLQENWVAFFAVRNAEILGPIWVADAGRSDVFYFGPANRIPEGDVLIPDVDPASVLATYLDPELVQTYQVGIWIYDAQFGRWVSGDPMDTALLPLPTPTPTPSPTPRPAQPRFTETLQPVSPTPTATEALTATLTPAPCGAEDLTASAWYFNRQNTVDGWEVTVYAEGRGGNCVYTYAWNEVSDIRGGPIAGCVTFRLHSPDRRGKIIGTVIVTSGDEMVRVGLYIEPPGD